MADDYRERAQNVDVTVWVGKAGIGSVLEELDGQLEERDLVKVKFLRAARGERGTAALATDLEERVDATLVETRGHTAVYRR